MLALCKLVDVSVCASQAAAKKAQPLWQQLGFQAKINERKKIVLERPATFCKRNVQEEFGDEGDEILRWWKRKLPEMENKFGG